MNMLERLIAVIAPHECLNCQKEGSLLCYECQLTLPRSPEKCYRCGRTDGGSRVCKACRQHSPLYSLLAVTSYEGIAKDIVRGLKYGRKQAAATSIANTLAHRLTPLAAKDVIVTYAPTAATRVRVRGYDQADLIARVLAQQLDLPCYALLARTGVQRQVGQSRLVRKQQINDAFRPINSHLLANKHVLLIDDVITTGATLEAAARALRSAGAKRVSAAVFAAA